MRRAGAFSATTESSMDPTTSLRPIDTPGTQPAQTVEVRARIPVQLRDQLEQLANRSFRSMAGEVAAACSCWVEQQSKGTAAAPAIVAGLVLIAAAPALAQTCGALGSPGSIGGCVVPGQYGAPSVRIKSDPLNPGGFRYTPVTPSPSYPTNLPPGLNRDYSRPNVPGLY